MKKKKKRGEKKNYICDYKPNTYDYAYMVDCLWYQLISVYTKQVFVCVLCFGHVFVVLPNTCEYIHKMKSDNSNLINDTYLSYSFHQYATKCVCVKY